MIDKENMSKLLGSGVDPGIVAQMVGCSQSYINECMEDDKFAQAVVAGRMQAAAKHVEHDANIDDLEKDILVKLKQSLAWCNKPEILLRAFDVLNKAQRRAGINDLGRAPQAGTVINITLPPVMVNAIKLNAQGQVVQVGERELVTLDSKSFGHLADGHKTLGQRLSTLSNIDEETIYAEVERDHNKP